MNECSDVPAANLSPLVEYVLRGLDNCWLPNEEKWSHIYHLDGRPNPNVSQPASDVFYTLNVLLGLSRLQATTYSPRNDLKHIFELNAGRLPSLPVARGAYGMAMWSSAELGFAMPSGVARHVKSFISEKSNWPRLRAQELGLIISGVVAQARHEPSTWSTLSHELFAFLVDRFSCPSGLFFDAARGVRRRWASFATQTYLTLACYHYGEFAASDMALSLANKCTQRLIELQGPNGEWPWFYYVPHGTVVEFYEVFSVHQHGMAPAFLEHAERHGVRGSTSALKKGAEWIFGSNQLGRNMLASDKGLIIRSHARRSDIRNRQYRAVRAVVNALMQRPAKLARPDELTLRLECRSYELGWTLWSFGRRQDLPEITHHAAFSARSALGPVGANSSVS